jgi:hypothetical protein
MGQSRGRLVLVVALTLAALATFGAAPATAAPAAAEENRETTLVAGHPNPLAIHLSLMPRAKLTDTQTGAPLEGQLVRFYLVEPPVGPAPNLPRCFAYTDAAGVAKCGSIGVRRDIFWAGATYRAEFAGATLGDVHYEPSEDTIRLLGRQ